MAPFERVFRALTDAGVRHVVVGGFAAVLHGHARLTADIDLVLDRRDAVEFDLDTYRVRAASLHHLIEMKRRVGRPQDLLDVEALEAILASKRAGDA